LKDPVARDDFLEKHASIEAAMEKVVPTHSKKRQGIVGDLEELAEAIKRHPWTSLVDLKGDQNVIRKIEETEKLLKELRRSLCK
jgi:hypothetical protein